MITIAIPLFNSEKYIRQCLISVLAQTYQDIEVLIVNDCSTDNSIGVINTIIAETPHNPIQIRVVNQDKNQGVAMARNRAIMEAKGDYIYFMDSDDSITHDCIEKLYNAVIQHHSNFAVGSICYCNEANYNNKKNDSYEKAIITTNEDFFRYKYAYTSHTMFGFSIFNTLFNIDFIRKNKLFFRPLRRGEDHIFFLEMMPKIKSCIILPDITYYYLQRAGSLSCYEARQIIPAEEVEQSVRNLRIEWDIIQQWKDNYYFPEILFHHLREAIWQVQSIIRKKDKFEPYFPLDCVKYLCSHPLSLNKILKLKRKKAFNILFFIFSCLPFTMQFFLLTIYVKRR